MGLHQCRSSCFNGLISRANWYKHWGRPRFQAGGQTLDPETRIGGTVLRSLKLPPRFRLHLTKDDPVRLELEHHARLRQRPESWVVLVNPRIWVAPAVNREGRIPGICKEPGTGRCATARSPLGLESYAQGGPADGCSRTGMPAIVSRKPPDEDYHPSDERGMCADPKPHHNEKARAIAPSCPREAAKTIGIQCPSVFSLMSSLGLSYRASGRLLASLGLISTVMLALVLELVS